MSRLSLTIDVEDWFQPVNCAPLIPPARWGDQLSRLEAMVDACLELLDRRGRKATFFVVGWLAERHGSAIRRIADRGHEVASHSHWHRPVPRDAGAEFAEDIRRAKGAIEGAIGREVRGFRAPGLSIFSRESYALDEILEAGYRYDSSVRGKGTEPFEIRPGLIEIPPSSIALGRRRYPTGGGFFFRALPYPVYRRFLARQSGRREALNFYFHSWEAYAEYPRLRLPWPGRFVQYYNLGGMPSKLDRLLRDFPFTSIERAFPCLFP